MIQDQMLRELFKMECEEHLQQLEVSLLSLEQSPAEKEMLELAFREAHSIKGAARMLGLVKIQNAANKLEDSLNSARRGLSALSSSHITQMLKEIEIIGGMVEEAVAVAANTSSPAKAIVSEPEQATEANPSPEVEEPIPAQVSGQRFQIDSVRVETRQLDELMKHVGELVVIRTRVTNRLTEIDDLMDKVNLLQHGLRFDSVEQLMTEFRLAHSEDAARLEALSNVLESNIRRIRLLPLTNLLKLFPRMVRDLSSEQGKDIELVIEGEDTPADKRILEEMKDPLMHMLRNAVDHGIETPGQRKASGKQPRGRIVVRASQGNDCVLIEISDDGAGLDLGAIRQTALQRRIVNEDTLQNMSDSEISELIFSSGFSTKHFVTDVSGRGVGMDVVRTNVERLKGSLSISSEPGQGTKISISLPVTLATMRVLLFKINGHYYGLSVDTVSQCHYVSPAGIFSLKGRSVVLHRGLPVSVTQLSELFDTPKSLSDDASPCIFLHVRNQSFAVIVDEVVDEQEIVLRPQMRMLQDIRVVLGTAILSSGDICTILNPIELLQMLPRDGTAHNNKSVEPLPEHKKLILLAEDSITIRTHEIRIMEAAGYEVVAAVDGQDAYTKLATRPFDALVSDINMPIMDGLELAEKIRALPQYAGMPIILVTSLASDEDKRRGLQVGANAYITKPEFDQTILLECLERLVG